MSDVLLAEKWSDEDPAGWWVSEKLDGVRAVWKNGEFVSRGDNTFACPEWFAKKMPAGCTLDGELWGGRRQFQKTVGIVKSSSRSKEWEFLTYMVFDALSEKGTSIEHRPFEERLASVKTICAASDALKAVPMQKCRGRDHLTELLTDVETRGGEGLMLRRPGSIYERRRSKSLLKVKTFHDEEAVVVGHETGKGRLSAMCGALLCETPDKRRFKVGSGLSDAQRHDPPRVGAVITYRFQELTNANIPRFPTLAGERVDLDWRHICSTYVPPGKKIESALRKNNSVLFENSGGPETSAQPSAPSKLRRGLSAEDAAQRGAVEDLEVPVAVEDLDDYAGDSLAVLFGECTEELPRIAFEPPAKKPRTSTGTVDKRPICVFGVRCYRRNPEHFLECAHPWRDEENEDVAIDQDMSDIAPVPAASASTSAPPPTTRPETPTESAVGDRGAVPESARAPAAPSSSVVAPEVTPPPSAVTMQDIAPGRGDEGVTAPPDVRIIALRSLLNSLVKDAAEHSQRARFEQMLHMIDSDADEKMVHTSPVKDTTESKPPLPPPDLPPPLSMRRSAQASTPSATGPAASSDSAASVQRPLLQPAPTVAALPEEIAKVVSTFVPAVPGQGAFTSRLASALLSTDTNVDKIMDLGFSATDAAEALKNGRDIQAAIEWLLAR